MEGYRIGQAAEAIGVRVETLRRWERDGKLTTVRTSGGQRLVPAAEVSRLVAERRAGRAPAASSRRNAFPGDHEGHPRQGLRARGDPSRTPPGGLSDHARSGRRTRPRSPGWSRAQREGNKRHGGSGPLKRNLVLAKSSGSALLRVGDSGGGGDGSETSSPEVGAHRVGAASLTEAFGEIAEDSRRQTPGPR